MTKLKQTIIKVRTFVSAVNQTKFEINLNMSLVFSHFID